MNSEINKLFDINTNIKHLIAQGKEEYVIEYLLHNLSGINNQLYNDCVLISSKLRQITKEYRNGLVNRDEYQINFNKIIVSLISLIDEIGSDSLSNLSLSKYSRIEHKDSFYEMPLTNEVIGNYIIGEFINYGGFGTVYKAKELITKEDVAIKISKPLNISDLYINDIVSFGRKVMKIPYHPNILQTKSIGQSSVREEKVIYHVMELINYGDLNTLIYAPINSIDLNDKINIFTKICHGLHFAHTVQILGEFGNTEIGIVHGDIKPSNILIAQNLEPKIADFMLVDFYLINEEDQQIQNSLLNRNPTRAIGTKIYMAPEQLSNGVINFKTDIYSLGVLLFELLTSNKPYLFMKEIDIMDKIQYIKDERKDKLANIITKCMQYEPDKRYNTVHELLDDLNKLNKESTWLTRIIKRL